ncbi:MAG: YitT family protein [Oscillospiraceae bacterium]|nr:YitT family protein [Oscillospiraceae bacterium]
MIKNLKSYLLVITGSCLTASAFGLIVLPNQFAAGGVTGFSVLLQNIIPLPVSVLVLAVNLSLFLLGWIFVGKDFVFKTLITSIIFPFVLEITQQFDIFHELAADSLVSSILAGAILGLGCGFILLGNGSGGGFDILGVILNKKFGISVSIVMYICDFIIILTQTVANGMLKTVYGVIVILVSTMIIDKVLVRGKSAGRIFIFSEKHEEIRLALLDKLDVGMSYINGENGYRRKETKIIMTVVHFDMVEKVKRSVYSIDPTAFVVVDNVHYVSGRGYTMDR